MRQAVPLRWKVLTGLMLLASAALPARAQQEVASVEQLKTEAFKALRGGQFDRTNELLERAAAIAHDPSVTQMARWINQFETQRQVFVAERKKEYDKAVGDVQLLLKNHKDDYAIDAASRAYLLAADKKTFRNEKWVADLIRFSAASAEKYESAEQWLKALRFYSDLSAIEPSNPLWKDRLKLATRRMRLLAVYTPESLKHIQESELREREEVDALLNPTTKPTTKPTTEPNDSFKIDWRESLRGIKPSMLDDALVDARNNYYRDVSFRDLGLGGLNGLQTLATTKGLEKAFPKLGDEAQKTAFVTAVQENVATMRAAPDGNEQTVLKSVIQKVRAANQATVQIPDEVLISEFADGAFAELDPFTSMIWPNDLDEFNKTTQGEFSGVGIQIQNDDDGSLKVVSPLEDSPAYKAGIKAGDIITRINGKSAKGITLNQAVKTITGPSGTTVILTVRSPSGATRDYTIERRTIKVASIKGWVHKAGGGWDWLVDSDNKIAYIRLTNFTKTTADELDKAVDELKGIGAKAIILDLRYNPGGLLTAATEVSDKFLHEGVIVSTRADRDTPNQPTVATAKGDDNECDMNLVVLVNQYSASASEIVSGALKDHKRAMLVGERTFGKGSVQMLFPLDRRQAYLKLTTSHYYLPLGRCIHREENSTEWGVDPDLTVEMTPEQMRAAIDARQELDILRDANAPPAEGAQKKLDDVAPAVGAAVEKKGKSEKKDLLTSDPQLAAALLILRMQLAGAQL